MRVISEHISYLLRYHDCVIVPGFGAFVRSYQPAALSDDGRMMPPTSHICFNSSIASNDGMLAHSLMRRENVSFEKAQSLLDSKTEQLKRDLSADGEVQIGSIGVISLGEDNTLSFAPCLAHIPSGEEAISRTTLSRALVKESEKSAEETAGRRVFDTHRNYYIAVNKTLAKAAASLIVAIAFAATFVAPSLRDSRPSSANNYASVVPLRHTATTLTSSAELKENSAQSSKPDINIEQIPMAEKIAESAPKATTSATEADFYLIVGTFASDAKCEKFIADTKASNLRIISGSKTSKVYYASSNSREELIDIMNSEEFRKEFKEAWVWKRP